MFRKLIILFTVLFAYSADCQHSLKKMPYPVNTDVYDEICPILSYNEDELYFTRVGSPDFEKTLIENGEDLSETKTDKEYWKRLIQIYKQITGKTLSDPTTSTFNQDVWYASYYKGNIYNLFHPSHPLNNALPNSICSHYGTEDGFVVINQFEKEGGVQAGFSFVQKESDVEFTHPEPIVIQDFNKIRSEVNLNMSVDKEYLIIAMDGKNSNGDRDLYVCFKIMENMYSPPKHLGRSINTKFREATPFFSQDKTKLYFASNRPGGYGGMDIYVSERLDYTFQNWSEPQLIGRPINSPDDDSHPYVGLDENSILFTSNRDGSSDIFYAQLNRDSTLNQDIIVNISIRKAGESEASSGQLYWSEAYKDEYNGFFRARSGEYTYTFTENNPMQFKAENRGFVSDVTFIDPQELQNKGIYEIDIELIIEKGKGYIPEFKRPEFEKTKFNSNTLVADKEEIKKDSVQQLKDDIIELRANSTVVLKNILFERARPDVLPSSYPALIKLANTVKRRPDVIIQVEGHTDNVGDHQALLDLSLSRANAIRDYLIKYGVPPHQVRAKGYGDSRPITNNRTEEERSKNRRVEIRILTQGGEE